MGETLKQSLLDISCGSIGGMAGKLIEYPFDTVKVRLQTQPDGRAAQFRGAFHCFQQTFQHEGFRGFYRGLSTPLWGAMAENATLFFTYNQAQSLLKSSHLFLSPHASPDTLSMTGLVAAGAISGAFTSYVLTPIELIKCKLQVQNVGLYPTNSPSTTKRPHPLPALAALHTSAKPMNPGPLQLIQQIYRTQGMRGFWRGQTGTFFRETGGNAAWFGTYEYVSSLLKRDAEVSTLDRMISGAFAGMAYNLVLFPADSIKSRMQTEIVSDMRIERGFWEVGGEMWRLGGVKVFYRGCLITVLRAAPASAVIFSVYEELKRIAQ